MCVKMGDLIKGLFPCLLLLSFVAVACADDDTRFTLRDGVISDQISGLQWAPAPDRPMNHYQAEEYALKLSLAGGGWRLPTIVELLSIYDKSEPGGANAKFRVADFFVWTSYLVDSSYAGYFIFGNARDGSAARDTLLPYIRVLAVRARR